MTMATQPKNSEGAAEPWRFIERHPWEAGFADYFRECIVPDLQDAETQRQIAERRYRRRLPLAATAGVIFTLLIAEASGSLPITLFWAIVLVILGSWLAQKPVSASRERSLLSIRDRVAGFFGLRYLPAGHALESELHASGLLPQGATLDCGGQLWGIHEGTPVHLARVAVAAGPSMPSAPQAQSPLTPSVRLNGAERVTGGLAGARPAEPLPGPALLIQIGASATNEGAVAKARLGLVANLFADVPVYCATNRGRILLLVQVDPGAWDWTYLAEQGAAAGMTTELEQAIRAMLHSLHTALLAARLLKHESAGPDPLRQPTQHPASCEKI